MNNFLNKMKYNTVRFMAGRYGFDELSKVIFVLSVVCMFLSLIEHLTFMYLIALLLMAIACFRSYSKNLYKRRNELIVYLRVKDKAKSVAALRKRIWSERKTYKYIKCSKCKTYMRVPKGKGKIVATCPKCSNKVNAKV